MYVLVSNGGVGKYPYTVFDLRRDNPNTSFIDPMSDQELAEWGVFPVVPRNAPLHDPATQNVSRVDPTLEDGQWVETWRISEASAAEVDERMAAQWTVIRSQRNEIISSSDWTQLQDVPLSNEDKDAWVTYRQALRDVTNQVDPFNITWPDAP